MKLLKPIALICALSMALSQVAFASEWDDTTDKEAVFYSEYGYENKANVYYNGDDVEFSDVFPLIREGTTFVPIRAVSDSLGAETTYIASTHSVKIVKDDITVFFDIGSANVSVNDEIMTLTTETFIIEGTTMVPLRVISEAFDLDVSWNNTYKEVSIIDINALKEGLDTDYTLIDSMLEFKFESEKSTLISGEFQINVSSSGKEFAINSDVSTLVDGSTIDSTIDVTMDFDDFKQEILDQLEIDNAPQDFKDQVIVAINDLGEFSVDFLLDAETLEMYFKSDKLATICSLLFNDSSITTDTWLKISLSEFLLDEYSIIFNTATQNYEKETTLENIIDALIEINQEVSIEEMNMYKFVVEILECIGDDDFVKSGYTYQLVKGGIQDNIQSDAIFTIKTNSKGEILSYEVGFDLGYHDDKYSFVIAKNSSSVISLGFTFDVPSEDKTVDALFEFDFKKSTEIATVIQGDTLDLTESLFEN